MVARTRAVPVTDRTSPIVSATTQLPRQLYDAFTRRAIALDTTKSALLRKLVEDFVAAPAAEPKGPPDAPAR
jgi:hypothetical protein